MAPDTSHDQCAENDRDAWDCNCPGNTPHDHLFKPTQDAETVVAQDAWSVVFEALCDSYDPYAEDGFSVTTGTEAVLDALRRAGLLIDGTPAQPADTVRDWRATMEHPCTCPPRPSTDECPRVEECYEAWSAARNDGGEGDES